MILERLGRQNPLGLTKLGSICGSIERIFGLSIAAGIDSFKVCRCNLAIPTPLGSGVSNRQAHLVHAAWVTDIISFQLCNCTIIPHQVFAD